MADYTSDVAKSTQGKSPAEYDDFTKMMRQTMQSAQQQYGGKYQTPSAAPASLLDVTKAKATQQSGEFDRRQAAASGKMNLAKAIDTRQGTMANRVRQALYGRSEARQEAQDKMSQTGRTAGMQTEKQMQGFNAAVGKMNFYSYKSEADRVDALRDAYRKGTVDFQMVDAARNNMLQMADIDKYFSMLTNDLNNQLNRVKAEGQSAMEEMIAKYESASRNSSSIISGLFDIGAAYMSKK